MGRSLSQHQSLSHKQLALISLPIHKEKEFPSVAGLLIITKSAADLPGGNAFLGARVIPSWGLPRNLRLKLGCQIGEKRWGAEAG